MAGFWERGPRGSCPIQPFGAAHPSKGRDRWVMEISGLRSAPCALGGSVRTRTTAAGRGSRRLLRLPSERERAAAGQGSRPAASEFERVGVWTACHKCGNGLVWRVVDLGSSSGPAFCFISIGCNSVVPDRSSSEGHRIEPLSSHIYIPARRIHTLTSIHACMHHHSRALAATAPPAGAGGAQGGTSSSSSRHDGTPAGPTPAAGASTAAAAVGLTQGRRKAQCPPGRS